MYFFPTTYLLYIGELCLNYPLRPLRLLLIWKKTLNCPLVLWKVLCDNVISLCLIYLALSIGNYPLLLYYWQHSTEITHVLVAPILSVCPLAHLVCLSTRQSVFQSICTSNYHSGVHDHVASMVLPWLFVIQTQFRGSKWVSSKKSENRMMSTSTEVCIFVTWTLNNIWEQFK